jgi:hypothetical protein
MTDMEKGSSLHGWHKRMEALVALAMSRAIGAFKLASTPAPPFVAGAISILNAAPIAAGGGPGSAANQVTFASAPHVTPASGKVHVEAQLSVVVTAADAVQFGFVRDAGSLNVSFGPIVDAQGTADGSASASLDWVDTGAPAGPHTYSIRATNANSNVISALVQRAAVTLMDVT